MPRSHGDTSAAALLGAWTDSDTAMQIVGTSLGIFGPDLLDPELALSSETPLRNALFDVLLSLVEGGAIDMRPTDDGLYAFRWRSDYAVAGLSPETSIDIDLDPPSPYLVELTEMKRARDHALERAKVAEALAQERERLLRLNDVPVPAQRVTKARAPRKVRASLDEQEQSILDVLYASQAAAKPESDEIDIRARDAEIVAVDLVAIEVESIEIETVEVEPIAAETEPEAPVSAAKPRTRAKPKPKATAAKAAPAKATVAKATVAKATVAKPAPAKATKPRAAKATKATKPETAGPEAAESESSDVVYLTPPAPDARSDDLEIDLENEHLDDDAKPRRAKWSGYTLDKPRMHLSSVDRIADEG